MLILSRKINESLRLIVPNEHGKPTTIFISINDIIYKEDRIAIGITAPENVRILRDEITPQNLVDETPNPFVPRTKEERDQAYKDRQRYKDLRRQRRGTSM